MYGQDYADPGHGHGEFPTATQLAGEPLPHRRLRTVTPSTGSRAADRRALPRGRGRPQGRRRTSKEARPRPRPDPARRDRRGPHRGARRTAARSTRRPSSRSTPPGSRSEAQGALHRPGRGAAGRRCPGSAPRLHLPAERLDGRAPAGRAPASSAACAWGRRRPEGTPTGRRPRALYSPSRPAREPRASSKWSLHGAHPASSAPQSHSCSARRQEGDPLPQPARRSLKTHTTRTSDLSEIRCTSRFSPPRESAGQHNQDPS